MKIALAGNPNSGKTTMFNVLTGRNEKVGNWAGVTVDKKEHAVRKSLYSGECELIAVDLPGAYSMSPFTSEESVTSDYIRNEAPDVIINIVDGTNLSRSLFFTTQILELGIPTVVALNKTDVNKKRETEIDIKLLSELLGCPVVQTVSTSGEGVRELVGAAISVVGREQSAPGSFGCEVSDKATAEKYDRERFAFVGTMIKRVEKRKIFSWQKNTQDKIDSLITNKWLGIPIFAVIMFLVFWISQVGPGVWIAEGYEFKSGFAIPGLVTLIEWLGDWLGSLLAQADVAPILHAIVVDGIIGGVGAVIGFLPLVMVMYFLISLLEDCGYMARATVVLDPIFKRVGLTGKSVIPFVMGTGCAVPGVMACRTIKNERERRATAVLAPFMPCGAKLPVISLFAGAFFGESPWVGTAMYFVGILVILLGSFIVNTVTGHKARASYFIIELPEYKLPSVPPAAKSMLSRGWAYIVKAGTVILVCNFVVQLMQSFSWSFSPVDNAADSILASVSFPFAYIFAPVFGIVAWQLAAAAITGFIAKENVVGTLAVCIVGLENLVTPEQLSAMQSAGQDVAGLLAITRVAALAYLMFNLFTPPCFAAIGAMNSELKSKKWLLGALALQMGMGYSVSFIVFFFGSLITVASLGSPWMPVLGWSIVLLYILGIVAVSVINRKRIAAESIAPKVAERV